MVSLVYMQYLRCFFPNFPPHQAWVLLTTFHLFSQVNMILAQTIQVALFMTVKQVNKTAPKIGNPSCNSTESTLHPAIQLPDSNHRDLSTSHLVPSVSKYILQPIHLTFFKHFKLSFISSNRQTKIEHCMTLRTFRSSSLATSNSSRKCKCCCNTRNIMKYLQKSWHIQKTPCGMDWHFWKLLALKKTYNTQLVLFDLVRLAMTWLSAEPSRWAIAIWLWWQFSFLASLKTGLDQTESWQILANRCDSREHDSETHAPVKSKAYGQMARKSFRKLLLAFQAFHPTKHESSWQPFILWVRLSRSWHTRFKVLSSMNIKQARKTAPKTGNHVQESNYGTETGAT